MKIGQKINLKKNNNNEKNRCHVKECCTKEILKVKKKTKRKRTY